MTSSFFLKSFVSLVILFPLTLISFAQNKIDAEYAKESKAFQKEIWGWKAPAFTNYTIPEEYKKYSKVVIANHTIITSGSKTKMAYYGLLMFGKKQESNIIQVNRQLVLLNDKVAVDEFSELSFTKFTTLFNKNEKQTTYIGVRVIKPDGKIKVVEADNLVSTKDENNDKKAKLAIADLQIGDKIDYYIVYNKEISTTNHLNRYFIPLFDNSPVLNLRFEGAFGKDFAFDIRSYNNAPDLKIEKGQDGEVHMELNVDNIPASETELWVSPAIQLPYIRINATVGQKAGATYKRIYDFRSPGELNINPSPDDVLQRVANGIGVNRYYELVYNRNIERPDQNYIFAARSIARKNNQNFDKWSDSEKAAFLFYMYRFDDLLKFDINKLEQSINIGKYELNWNSVKFSSILNTAGIKTTLLATSDRTDGPLDKILDKEDVITFPFIDNLKKGFLANTIYANAFYLPAAFDGVKESMFIDIKYKNPKMFGVGKGSKVVANDITLPVSSAKDNAHTEKLEVSFNDANSNLTVKRESTVKGNFRLPYQSAFVLYEDFYEQERLYFNEKYSLLESLEKSKASRKHIDEVKNALDKARKDADKEYAAEAEASFGQKIENIRNKKVINMGVRHDNPDFVFTSEFELDGLIKQAGNNYILEIGKIIGPQTEITEAQKNRTLDVYFSFARAYNHQINFIIPAGYQLDGIETLNKSVENNTGSFIAKAAVKGNVLSITVQKQYKNNYEPVSNWNGLLAVLEEANNWSNTKLLLKKQ